MARANFVKKALKDNPVAKKGESYWWWQPFRGAKRFSKERPKPSQLASNEDDSDALAIGEEIEGFTLEGYHVAKDLETARDEWVERIRAVAENVDEKFNNLPDGLQQAETGQQLEEKASNLNEWADELEGVDIDDEAPAEDLEDIVAALQEHGCPL